MIGLVDLLCLLFCRRKAALKFLLVEASGGFVITTPGDFIVRIYPNQAVLARVVPANTPEGNPSRLDGPVNFAAEPAEGVTIERVDDNTVRIAPAAGFLGAVQVTATADADLDVGEERVLTASGVLEVVSEEAQSIEIQFELAQ